MTSAVVHPVHYNVHPSGIECIDLVEKMMFNSGNVLKYLWRFREKGNPIQDLEKALFYAEHEVKRLRDPLAFRFIAVDRDLAERAMRSVEGFERDAYSALLNGCELQNAEGAAGVIRMMLSQERQSSSKSASSGTVAHTRSCMWSTDARTFFNNSGSMLSMVLFNRSTAISKSRSALSEMPSPLGPVGPCAPG